MNATAIEPQTAVWTCKDGRKVRVCDMDDRHLLNTIALLERCYRRAMIDLAMSAWRYAETAPDGAAMAAEDAAEQALEEADEMNDIASKYPIYAALAAEKERRNL